MLREPVLETVRQYMGELVTTPLVTTEIDEGLQE